MSGYDMNELAFAGGATIVAILVFLVVLVFELACFWKIYKKMGEPGWASIVPFYCNWVLCKHTWGHGAMMFTWMIPGIGFIFAFATWFKLFKGFGKSGAFAFFGTLLFAPIALAICAFGKSEFTDR